MKPIHSLAAVTLMGLSGMSLAATPESGTLSLDTQLIEFSQGPNFGVNPTSDLGGMCEEPLLPCDHFDLQIDLPENIGEVFPWATVTMNFTWDDASGSGAEDYDIYMYDENGSLVAKSTTLTQPETIEIYAAGGVQDFRFDVVYYTALGSTYTGIIELTLGEPAEGADVDEFFAQNSLLERVLVADDSDDEETGNAYVERRAAGGALNLFALALVAGAFSRRRRVR